MEPINQQPVKRGRGRPKKVKPPSLVTFSESPMKFPKLFRASDVKQIVMQGKLRKFIEAQGGQAGGA
jgi:hypothetical protein